MKSLVISKDRDTILAYRLAGILGKLAENDDEALDTLTKSIINPNIGIIMVTEDIYEKYSEHIFKMRKQYPYQLIIAIPDSGGLRDKNFLVKQIKESIGIKI